MLNPAATAFPVVLDPYRGGYPCFDPESKWGFSSAACVRDLSRTRARTAVGTLRLNFILPCPTRVTIAHDEIRARSARASDLRHRGLWLRPPHAELVRFNGECRRAGEPF